jgi:hypothetical protein
VAVVVATILLEALGQLVAATAVADMGGQITQHMLLLMVQHIPEVVVAVAVVTRENITAVMAARA